LEEKHRNPGPNPIIALILTLPITIYFVLFSSQWIYWLGIYAGKEKKLAAGRDHDISKLKIL
jgi:hypothetical protein